MVRFHKAVNFDLNLHKIPLFADQTLGRYSGAQPGRCAVQGEWLNFNFDNHFADVPDPYSL